MKVKRDSYLVELVRIGNQVKATACDPVSGTEACIIAPANATRKDLCDLAVRKLEYVLKKEADKGDQVDG